MAIIYEGNESCGGLPKWPAIVVVGEPVTPDQAAEIILRTDHSIPDPWGNNHDIARRIMGLFGVPPQPPYEGNNATEEEKTVRWRLTHARWQGIERLRSELGCISLEYLNHDRVLSSYIGGASGWCNWDGTIGIRDRNIGKWPEPETVAEEWQCIHDAFPFLNLRCQLYNAEFAEDNPRPVVHYIVRNGDIIVRPSNGAVLKPPPLQPSNYQIGGQLEVTTLYAKLESVYNGNIPQYQEILDDE